MKFFSLMLSAFLFLTACNFGGHRVSGNGTISSQERNVSGFEEVKVGGDFKVYIIQGEVKPVKIEGDENLLEYVELNQSGKELSITTRDGVNLDASSDMKIYLTAPMFRRIQASGASDIISQGKLENEESIKISVSGAGDINMEIDAPEIESSITGSGNITLKGEAKNVDLRISGAGKARCYDLKAENTEVHITGAGDADVYASEKLDARVSGAGSVRYKGDPKDVIQHVTGAGSVKKN